MGKYLKKFDNHSQYESYIAPDYTKPNVSYCVNENEVHYNPYIDYSKQYLRTTALNNGTIVFIHSRGVDPNIFASISYSTDNGSTWTTVENQSGQQIIVPVAVNAGDNILWKGSGTYMCTYDRSDGYVGSRFASSDGCQFNVDGNIMSLLYGDDFENETTLTSGNGLFAFATLFLRANIVNAENLILPATTLAQSCYAYMFYQCTSLTIAPVLPATAVNSGAYDYMFYGCSNLNYIKCLATNTSVTNSTTNWVNGVAANGTFTKAASMSSWTTGNNGIPNGWTVKDASE